MKINYNIFGKKLHSGQIQATIDPYVEVEPNPKKIFDNAVKKTAMYDLADQIQRQLDKMCGISEDRVGDWNSPNVRLAKVLAKKWVDENYG
jgi:hypothetical protein